MRQTERPPEDALVTGYTWSWSHARKMWLPVKITGKSRRKSTKNQSKPKAVKTTVKKVKPSPAKVETVKAKPTTSEQPPLSEKEREAKKAELALQLNEMQGIEMRIPKDDKS